MKPIRLIALTLLLAVSGLPLMGHAGAESGAYIGAGADNSTIKGPINEVDMGEESPGDITYTQTSFNGSGI
jgi:hypothetical protein